MRVYSGGSVPVDASNITECVRMVTCGRGNIRAWRLKEDSSDSASPDKTKYAEIKIHSHILTPQ